MNKIDGLGNVKSSLFARLFFVDEVNYCCSVVDEVETGLGELSLFLRVLYGNIEEAQLRVGSESIIQ